MRSRSPSGRERYGYGGRVEYDLRPGGTYRAFASEDMKQARAQMGGAPTPDVIVDGEVVESDPPRRLVQTWRMLMDVGPEAEGFTRLTYEIAETMPGVSRLTADPRARRGASSGAVPRRRDGDRGRRRWLGRGAE